MDGFSELPRFLIIDFLFVPGILACVLFSSYFIVILPLSGHVEMQCIEKWPGICLYILQMPSFILRQSESLPWRAVFGGAKMSCLWESKAIFLKEPDQSRLVRSGHREARLFYFA